MGIRRFSLLFGLAVLALPLVTTARQDSGALIAQALPSYFPLATSTPLQITNSENPEFTGVPAWLFTATNGCTDEGTGSIFGIVNSDDSTILGVNCGTGIGAHSGVFVHGLMSDGIENDALPTPSASPAPQVEPICGAYSVQEQVCQGYIAPTYTMSGAAATSSFSLRLWQCDGIKRQRNVDLNKLGGL
ncbi:MAG TPA: hypothetical protein VKR56_10350 [Candidatus Cybelea sp.]|nr:hypothetical protein [Candidatus Cybelea sp.]